MINIQLSKLKLFIVCMRHRSIQMHQWKTMTGEYRVHWHNVWGVWRKWHDKWQMACDTPHTVLIPNQHNRKGNSLGACIQHRVPVGMCIQRIFKWVCTTAQSDQCLSFPVWRNVSSWLPVECPLMTLIRLHGCAGGSESLIGAHASLYLLLDTASTKENIPSPLSS